MLYVTDMLFGDSYLTISYNFETSLDVEQFGNKDIETTNTDYWINEFIFEDLVVEINDTVLLDFIDEYVLAGHEDIVRAEEEARYGN